MATANNHRHSRRPHYCTTLEQLITTADADAALFSTTCLCGSQSTDMNRIELCAALRAVIIHSLN